jgi:hypothetical protein
MSNQGITRWDPSVLATLIKSKWKEGQGGMLSALNIQYTSNGQTQEEVIHVVYPEEGDSKQLPEVPF